MNQGSEFHVTHGLGQVMQPAQHIPTNSDKVTYVMHARVHLRLLQALITHKPNMIWRQNLHQSTSFAEAQKALEAHDCILSVTNLSIAPHTLGIPTANVTCCIDF